ncbi:MAG TPA: hypothetical protein DGT21_11265 [Armatimonadetes bacterium]|nr:hypothetical protein [Armatimonadota bacterium]
MHLEGATPVDVLWCDKDDPMHGMFKLQEILGRDRTADHLRITVDITTFTKQYLLVLLKWIEHHLPNAAVRTVYTPGQYGETRAQQARFTWGVKDIVTVPMYGMPPSPESSDVLVIFLGYERERTYRLWRTLEPDLTIAVIGVPPAFPGANYTSEILNARILNSKTDDIAIRSCSAVDPADAARLLCDVAAEHEGCNLVVAPLGTKMQTLGLYLFSRRREGRAAQIMYALPLRYDEKYYTVGHTSYVYEFDLAGAPK